MMDYDDFKEIERLLDKSCDNCLLTRKHCISCRIDKIRGFLGEFSERGSYEIALIKVDDLRTLINQAKKTPADAIAHEVVEKWHHTIEGITKKR